MSQTAREHDVALIGCGLLGSAFARALARGGFSVAAWNRTFARAESLAGAGIVPVRSVSEAVRSAPLVLACTTSCATTRSALTPVDDWRGTTLVNLSTGVPAEVEELERWARGRGADFLDGGPCLGPREAGTPGAVVYYSGSAAAWARHRRELTCLGGSSKFVSEKVTMTKTMLLGAAVFLIPALSAFVEAATYMRDQDVPPSLIFEAVDPFAAHLPRLLADATTAIVSEDHETDQATLEVWADGLRSALVELRASGSLGRVATATMVTLDAAEAAGLGRLAFSAQAKVA